jgi:hypothetical protein
MWQRYCRKWEALGNKRFHFHDLRAKSISDNANLDAAYLLAGCLDEIDRNGGFTRTSTGEHNAD